MWLQSGTLAIMEWLARVRQLFFRQSIVKTEDEGLVHDFTFTITGHVISKVKSLGDGSRVFLLGEANGLRAGDVVVIRAHSTAPKLRYRLDAVQTGRDGTFRAYAHVERQRLSVRTPARSFRSDLTTYVPMQRPTDKW